MIVRRDTMVSFVVPGGDTTDGLQLHVANAFMLQCSYKNITDLS